MEHFHERGWLAKSEIYCKKNGIKGRKMNKKYVNVGQILTMCCVYKSFIEKPELELEHCDFGNLIHGKYVTFIYNIYFVYK